MHSLDDTIAAIASPPGGGASGIVRLSGPRLRECLEDCFRPSPPIAIAAIVRPTAVPGLCWLRGLATPLPGELYLWPGKRSYTGQPVAEIHTLGSPPLLEALLRTVFAAGARLAAPGEFTFRAFLAGRIDLTQAEAVLGVIDAADPGQLHAALVQLAGGLARPLHRLRDELLDLLADLEASLDFAEEDATSLAPGQLLARLDAAGRAIARLIEQMASRRVGGELVRVVLAGPPNSGKSSLFNALVGGPGALVSDQPGTTRDYLAAEIDLDDVSFCLIDTAGAADGDVFAPQRHAEDAPPRIEEAAQAAAGEQRRQADALVICVDSSRPRGDFSWGLDCGAAARIVALTKCDLPRHADFDAERAPPGAIAVSSTSGAGLALLRARLREAALAARAGGEVVLGTALRCRELFRAAAECVARARGLVEDRGGEELVAAEVRAALDELGKAAGAVYSEDVLDRIFSRFCVGK